MTNSLIPHTFIPGTKARAQEVNANFISLAEEIQNTQQNTTNRIAQINEMIANSNEEAERKFADKDLVKTKTISNKIIKAPNGVITYEGQTVTVKNGLTVLIPSGLNADSRPESVQYTLTSDVSKTVTNLNNTKSTVFIYSNGTVDIISGRIVYYKDTSATANNSHKYVNNKWYKYSETEGQWQEVFAVPIADLVWDSNGNISSVIKYAATDLVTKSDFVNDNMLKGLLPENVDYIVETYNANGVYYRKYKSGWIEMGGRYNIGVNIGGNTGADYYINLPARVSALYANAVTETFCLTCGAFLATDNVTMKASIKNTNGSTFHLPAILWEVKGYAI